MSKELVTIRQVDKSVYIVLIADIITKDTYLLSNYTINHTLQSTSQSIASGVIGSPTYTINSASTSLIQSQPSILSGLSINSSAGINLISDMLIKNITLRQTTKWQSKLLVPFFIGTSDLTSNISIQSVAVGVTGSPTYTFIGGMAHRELTGRYVSREEDAETFFSAPFTDNPGMFNIPLTI